MLISVVQLLILLFPYFYLVLSPLLLYLLRTDARTVSSGSSAWEGQLTSLVLSEYASTEMSIHALYIHEVRLCACSCLDALWVYLKDYFTLFQPCAAFSLIKLHKQQSRGDLSRHTWHRQESDESSDSIPDEVRSEPNIHSRNFPRSQTFPATLPSPGACSASATSGTTAGQNGAKAQSGTQRRHSGPATGACLYPQILLLHLSVTLYHWSETNCILQFPKYGTFSL